MHESMVACVPLVAQRVDRWVFPDQARLESLVAKVVDLGGCNCVVDGDVAPAKVSDLYNGDLGPDEELEKANDRDIVGPLGEGC